MVPRSRSDDMVVRSGRNNGGDLTLYSVESRCITAECIDYDMSDNKVVSIKVVRVVYVNGMCRISCDVCERISTGINAFLFLHESISRLGLSNHAHLKGSDSTSITIIPPCPSAPLPDEAKTSLRLT